jgi:SPP1 gp7 family putative phage head morphogenesis protein
VASDNAETTAHTINLYRSIGLAKRPRKVLPRQVPPTMIAREYSRAILEYVKRLRAQFEPLLAELPRLLESAANDRRVDAGEGARVRQLMNGIRDRIKGAMPDHELSALAEKFAARTSTHHRMQLSKQLRAALGVDVAVQDRALRSLSEAFVDANVGLIKNIGDKLASDIEASVLRGVQTGTLHGDLAKELQERFGFAETRAKLIARDQVGKYYGQVNASRQRNLGVERFIWRTVKDERVREEHEELEGEEFRYDDPPDEGLPGEAVNCRCYAEPILDDVLALTDE